MGTNTIEIRDDVYERLEARKRENESFSDVVDRLLDETTVNWREGFGTLPEQDAGELEQIVSEGHNQTAEGLYRRQQEALGELADLEEK
ncbi:antitoxin VapB family protein [Haloarcula salina]|uniref:Antitoxin VapB family protein n=1 Tax=Haloarcula salina TaxID=1429914 RepID=A0AA41KKE5_9EURY|nr:antitoxin VapB family protein [Haloarcula salina]MBV0903728.1 antitoxin VapB family protein [Haloarcula salina]